MSWQLAAYLLLAVALGGGFLWYERTRPDARVVALVGTLAAFGALGRIAFAALPNVKPTTDIVLVSGYVLGGAPGFVVGAVSALTSNFFFGQGPWTPWQMLGWGMTGTAGAALARLSGRRIGRWPLAIVCFAVGFAFTVLQDFGDWVTYSDHSVAQLDVYVGKGLGFDLVHATGCLLFALAFGPSLTHSLQRFRLRLEVRWVAVAALFLAMMGTLDGLRAPDRPGIATAQATGAQPASITAPVGYLQRAQNADGGLGSSPGSASSPLYAGWAALGLEAAGYDPALIHRPGGATLAQYLIATVGQDSDAGSVERTILALRGAGLAVTDVGGRDLVAVLQHDVKSDGSIAEQTNWTAFGILALRAAGVAPAPKMVAWLARQGDADGGFNFATAGGPSDVDDTGAALQALAGSDRSSVVHRAVRFIEAQQNTDGGLPSAAGGFSNAQSTAFGVQGLIAAGVDVAALHRHGATPVEYLQHLTKPDGQIDYGAGNAQTPVWVTGEALLALAGRTLPLTPVVRATGPPRSARMRRVTHARVTRHARHAHQPRNRAAHASPRRGPLRAPAARVMSAQSLDTLAAGAGAVLAVALAPVDV
jgi:prenyltransferase/squalene oxidase-like repeat protein